MGEVNRIKIKNRIKVFISGKISNMPYLVAYGMFANADRILSMMGYKVVNPCHLCNKNWSWLRCMLVCLWHLIWCDCIYQLDNWQESLGSRIEHKWAKWLGKKVLTFKI